MPVRVAAKQAELNCVFSVAMRRQHGASTIAGRLPSTEEAMTKEFDRTRAGTMPRLPSARSSIASFIVMDVMQAAAAREAEGQRVIHMEVGQPGTPAPLAGREAAERPTR